VRERECEQRFWKNKLLKGVFEIQIWIGIGNKGGDS
jgi:hypothetical protein